MNDHQKLVDSIANSDLFRDFRDAFGQTTGMPVALQPVESWRLPLHGQKHENGFCSLMARQSHSCAHCLQMRHQLCEGARLDPCTLECGAGLSESAVPIRPGGQLIGYLHTGQVFQAAPTSVGFEQTAKFAGKLELDVDVAELQDAYFSTPVLLPEQFSGSLKLLSIFADQLALVAGQMMEQDRMAEPPVIVRAKQFINENFREDISLPQVAKACNTSTFYFCKLFKRHTGISFTQYLSRARLEKAKNLLLNHELTVSEIAFAVGFQSLTHFNRVFKKTIGCSPSSYRRQLPNSNGA